MKKQYFQLPSGEIIGIDNGNYEANEFKKLIEKEVEKGGNIETICWVFNFELIIPIKLEI